MNTRSLHATNIEIIFFLKNNAYYIYSDKTSSVSSSFVNYVFDLYFLRQNVFTSSYVCLSP
jgi:hypothetical protein